MRGQKTIYEAMRDKMRREPTEKEIKNRCQSIIKQAQTDHEPRWWIYDWAGNRLWKLGSFPYFDTAWDYIAEHFPDDMANYMVLDQQKGSNEL